MSFQIMEAGDLYSLKMIIFESPEYSPDDGLVLIPH